MPRGRPKGSKNRPKLSAYDKKKVNLTRDILREDQCHLFDKLPDADVARFTTIKDGNLYIHWDFTRSYVNDIGEKITKLLMGKPS
jgi:hypothetical protein